MIPCDLNSIEAQLSGEPGFPFGQDWLKAADRDLAPGIVRLGRRGASLAVFADLVDTSVTRESFEFNFPAFTKGDAFEIFLHAPGVNVYYEFHVTPSNSILQLRLPIVGREAFSLAECSVSERLFESDVRIQPPGWQVAALIPLSPLCDSLPIPEKWACSFGRYDYTLANTKPVISSTSHHAVCNFHRLSEWMPIDLRELPQIQ